MSELDAIQEQERKDIMQRTIEHHARMVERGQAIRSELEMLLKDKTKLVWEVGCGHGHFLTGYADAYPQATCIGVDIIEDRIHRGERKRKRAELDNLHFIRAEATMFLEQVPEWVQLESVFILFPDPWPKTRHHKNRIMQAPFLADVAKRCAPGALLCFRTDFAPYFEAASEVVKSHPDWELRTDIAWPFELETVFQSRAEAYQSMIAVRR